MGADELCFMNSSNDHCHRTWPAVWTVGADWPNQVISFLARSALYLIRRTQGEVDILEGVNDQGTNQATLHTSAGTYRFLRSSRSTECLS